MHSKQKEKDGGILKRGSHPWSSFYIRKEAFPEDSCSWHLCFMSYVPELGTWPVLDTNCMESCYHDLLRPAKAGHWRQWQGCTATHLSWGCIDRRKQVGWVDVGETADKVEHRVTCRSSSPVIRFWNHCGLACPQDLSTSQKPETC